MDTRVKMEIASYIFGVSLLFYAGTSGAAFYKWIDSQGETHYTTAPPPESAIYDREVISDQGRVLETIQGKMTPEEKAILEKRLYEERQRAKALEEQNKIDRNLLIFYKKEQDIIAERDRKLSPFDEYIASLRENRDILRSRYKELLDKAISYERKGESPPASVTAGLHDIKRAFDDSEEYLEKAVKERSVIFERFVVYIKRWREIKKKNADNN